MFLSMHAGAFECQKRVSDIMGRWSYRQLGAAECECSDWIPILWELLSVSARTGFPSARIASVLPY